MPNQSDHHAEISLYEWSWLSAPSCKFAFDADTGAILEVSPRAEELTGYSRAELMGMHIDMLHPEEERERVRKEYLRADKESMPHPGLHLLRKDSQCIALRSFSSKALKQNGHSIVVVDCRDITDRVLNEHQLATQNWALRAYASTALALGQVHSSEGQLLQSICTAITDESVYPLAWIGIAEDGPGKPIRIAASAGYAVEYLDGVHASWSEDLIGGQGPTGTCIRTQQQQIVEDAETSIAFGPWRERATKYGIRSSVNIPLDIEGGWRGVLVVYAGQAKAFEPIALDVFQDLARQIAFGVRVIEQEKSLETERQRTSRMQKQLTEALSAMVEPIVLAMEMRDPYTAGHQTRVAEIACAMGREMGWNEDRLQGLRIAAQVHDIGKISIPAEILTKPGKLNDAERAMINQHSETGYTILKDIPFPWPIAQIVRQHHEKMDGTGYPLGLKGDEILPESRVLAVADIVEAMTCYRPYRQGIQLDTVLESIETDAGTKLDAEAVRICLDLFRNKHFMLPGLNRN
jgi:PAS domain S-box-containing protein/putative nucleotidyltransferase with HDIG domain